MISIKTTLKNIEGVKKLFQHELLHAPASNGGSLEDNHGTLRSEIVHGRDDNFSPLYSGDLEDLEPGSMSWEWSSHFIWKTGSEHKLGIYKYEGAIWADIMPRNDDSSFWAPLVLSILTEGFGLHNADW